MWDVIVLGAGAAGLMCAIEAGRRGRRVLVLDHAKAPGEKIRISGGGRCNFTNLQIAPERFLSQNPRFALSALRRYTQRDFIARMDRAGIAWHEKTLGQLFCDGSARQVVDMLLRDLAEAGGELRLGVSVKAVRPGYEVETDQGVLKAASVVVATGGKSIPKMGATGMGYQIAEAFDLPIIEPRPGLVPLTFTDAQLDGMKALAGVSVQARVGVKGAKIAFEEGMLFTHRGLSGPSILQISSYWREGQEITVDLAMGRDLGAEAQAARAERGARELANALDLPDKLARAITERAGLSGKLATQSKAALHSLSDATHRWHLTPAGTEGWRTAEVTLGGVDTTALDARTMQARAVPGLYFIGEVVDVTGWLGGYNFQWAWSSGWAAGQAV
ncbi:BaiN/RdsA family NAD(P)/FAD-dependent oxidoreductase [Pararhodobacter zhoushanensis]|uniref:NAD(P)/FAD-dependent oxidoreductase n=1 Tax=Pararhodobacter zhoushanensis TaxID=2479545 RepID=A0ABT3H0E4_9RHOB|nr:NAD(P)/FAD-dependent oxidoreductase [Pararhodobacter zhoushanensis]MCW1933180.1 NAD(P)/FAD-dependent oxidoreductase [Pararhodobacter zhoushanensis]